jgi:hypothetical protein
MLRSPEGSVSSRWNPGIGAVRDAVLAGCRRWWPPLLRPGVRHRRPPHHPCHAPFEIAPQPATAGPPGTSLSPGGEAVAGADPGPSLTRSADGQSVAANAQNHADFFIAS